MAKYRNGNSEMSDYINNNESISLDTELTKLGGALYTAIIKRLLSDEWESDYTLFLQNMRESMLLNEGLVDKESCLTEMAAAQRVGPAIENGYDKTIKTIDHAGAILGINTAELSKDKYIERGRRLSDAFKKNTKRLLVAAMVGGILFCGTPDKAPSVLMGPKPAEASTLLGDICVILASGLDVGYDNNRFEVDYDSEYIKNKAARYITRAAKDIVVDKITGIPDTLKADSLANLSTSARKLALAIRDSQYGFNKRETQDILDGISLVRDMGGLKVDEFVMCMLMVDPGMENTRLKDMCNFIASLGEISYDTLHFDAVDSSAAVSLSKHMDKDYDKEVMLTRFIANAAVIAERSSYERDGSNFRTFIGILNKTYNMSRTYYQNPALTSKIKAFLNKALDIAHDSDYVKAEHINNITNDDPQLDATTAAVKDSEI